VLISSPPHVSRRHRTPTPSASLSSLPDIHAIIKRPSQSSALTLVDIFPNTKTHIVENITTSLVDRGCKTGRCSADLSHTEPSRQCLDLALCYFTFPFTSSDTDQSTVYYIIIIPQHPTSIRLLCFGIVSILLYRSIIAIYSHLSSIVWPALCPRQRCKPAGWRPK